MYLLDGLETRNSPQIRFTSEEIFSNQDRLTDFSHYIFGTHYYYRLSGFYNGHAGNCSSTHSFRLKVHPFTCGFLLKFPCTSPFNWLCTSVSCFRPFNWSSLWFFCSASDHSTGQVFGSFVLHHTIHWSNTLGFSFVLHTTIQLDGISCILFHTGHWVKWKRSPLTDRASASLVSVPLFVYCLIPIPFIWFFCIAGGLFYNQICHQFP